MSGTSSLQPNLPAAGAHGVVPLDEPTRIQVQERVDAFVAELIALDPQSPEFGRTIEQISSIGHNEVIALASQSSRFLDPSVERGGGASVRGRLLQLRQVVEELDPAANRLLKPRRWLAFLPARSSLKAYFDKYTAAQEQIHDILVHLAGGRDQLLQDNIAIASERERMSARMAKLEQMIATAKALDEAFERASSSLDASDPPKAKAIRERAILPARRRTADLLTQMAVAGQAYLALDLIRNNNVELIEGIERASATTIMALRIAVTVAQVVADQRLILQQIGSLNSASAKVIEGIEPPGASTNRIDPDGPAATTQVASLQSAFQDIYQTLDKVDALTRKTLVEMKGALANVASKQASGTY